MMDDSDMQDFLAAHDLPNCYKDVAHQWFDPLCDELVNQSDSNVKPMIIGISGCQGSGKTTLSHYIKAYLNSVYNKTVVELSIDDFYLSHTDRLTLAATIHPLLKTRGVPGTHDMTLALNTFEQLVNGRLTKLPRFNKATDNPYPANQWETINYLPDVVILEGWCVSVTPQTNEALHDPINDLEAVYDANGRWRTYVNNALAIDYQTLFKQIDYNIFLKAPSFDCVYHWRLEQENKLANTNATGNAIMSAKQLKSFIQHYQRLTEHALKTLPTHADAVFYLDDIRNICKLRLNY